MKSPIQVICTDFDGTVFSEFEHPPIPDCLVERIGQLQNQGARWVINTGRDLSGLMEALGRSRIPIQPDYLVLVEREIYLHNGQSYSGLQHWNDSCLTEHDSLFQQVRLEVPTLAEWVGSNHRATVYEDAFSPFCVIAESDDDANHIQNFLEEFARQVPLLAVVRNDVYMRFCHSAYNKGTALSEICRILGVSAQETFVAGDHLNDLPMLQRDRAAWLAAPANAVPSVQDVVRKQGGYISRLERGDGVLEALDWCLKAARL